MKHHHTHTFKYMKKLKEDWCVCGETRKHRHHWIMYYQSGKIGVNNNFEECRCGELRDYIQMVGGKKEHLGKTNPKLRRMLKTEVRSWDRPVKLRQDFYKKQGKDLIEK